MNILELVGKCNVELRQLKSTAYKRCYIKDNQRLKHESFGESMHKN